MTYKRIDNCTRVYDNIDADKIEVIKSELLHQGATVTGSNPWKAVTHQWDTDLYGTWDQSANTLTVKVDSPAYVACSKVWDKIDPLMQKVQALPKKVVAPVEPPPVTPTTPASPPAPDVTPAPPIPATETKTNPLAASISGASGDNTDLYMVGALVIAAVAWFRFRRK